MKAPAFQFYVRDWLLSRAVSKMSGDGVKAYLYLLSEAWLEEPRATLPNNDEELSKMAQCSEKKWDMVKGEVMGCFILKDNRWVNEKLLGISETQSKFSKWGKMGGNPILTKSEPKEVNPMVNGSHNPIVNLATATATASSSSLKEEYTESFENFWKLYPRRIGKGNAYREWEKIKPSEEMILKIMQSLEIQIKTWNDPKYIKHPERWLKARCWEDDLYPISLNKTRPSNEEMERSLYGNESK